MRIAQLIETLGTGGAEKLAVDIAGTRLQCGDESSIITLSTLGPLSAGIQPGVAVYNLGMVPDNHVSQFFTLFKLYKLCRELRLDALQTHLPRANFFGLVMAMVADLPVFPTVHNNREFDYGDHPSALRKALRRFAYSRLVLQGRRMIAVSEAVKQTLVDELNLDEISARRVAVVPNGVRIPVPLTAQQKAEVRREYAISPDDVLIVGVGRLTPQKNFQDLISALEHLDSRVPGWHCIIAGDGPLRGDLEDLIRQKNLTDRVSLAGRISGVNRLLCSADIFCMPSLWEGLPLALLEAMAAELPVSAYAIDGVNEVVVHGQSGWLAAPGRIEELAGTLSLLLQDPDNRVRLGRAGRAMVEKEHGFSKMAHELGMVYAGQGKGSS